MSVATRPLTYDDLLDTPDDGNRYEIIGGELVVSPSPSFRHQMVSAALFRVIDRTVQAEGLGVLIYAPMDVRFHQHDIVEPDILFIRKERVGIIEQNLIEGAPDLVVEVLSPSSRHRDQVPKMAVYARAGVEEYWIADPEQRTLTIYALVNGTYQAVDAPGNVVSSRVLPGLRVEIDTLFSEDY